MFDFNKLRARTPEERRAAEERAAAEDIAVDRRRRAEYASKTVAIELTEDAGLRFNVAGDAIISMRGEDIQGRKTIAVFYAPSDFSRQDVDALLRALAANTYVTLDGFWKMRQFNVTIRFEFIAQFLTLANGASHPARA